MIVDTCMLTVLKIKPKTGKASTGLIQPLIHYIKMKSKGHIMKTKNFKITFF